jgi:lysyl-tRNA synthetase, class II
VTVREQPRLRRFLHVGPTLLAVAVFGLGLVDVISAVTPEQAERVRTLRQVLPLSIAHAASATTAVAGLLLMMLGHGLRRRKRRAWRAAVLLLLLSVGLHLAKGLDAEEAVVALLLAVLLVVQRREFYAAGDPTTRWRAPLVFVTMGAASFVFGVVMLYARGGALVGSPSLLDRAQQALYGLVGVAGPVHFRSDRASDVIFDILLAMGMATALVTAYLALRAPEPRARLSADDETRVRELLARQGRRDSLGYFALRRDKAVVCSETGKAAVSYRVVSGVMLASGDPLGDPEAWPGAIRVFLEEARRHAWVPAVMGCGELGGEVWVREAGMRALELGDEAICEVEDFTLEGRAMRNVRQMVTRVERAGYKTDVRRIRDMTAYEIADIRRQAAAWRGAVVERGFSMALGRFGDAGDGECVAVTAYKDDRLAAVLHFVPWGEDGLSLDLMRRDRAADPGLNELLIVAAMRAAPDLGVTRLSLNFAVFRSALERGGKLGAGPILRLWRELLLIASRWFQIESLYRFNAKFRPLWEPRFICYRNAREIPRVAIAALEAEAFIVWPNQWLASRRERHTHLSGVDTAGALAQR